MQNTYTLLKDKPCDLLLHYQRDRYRRRPIKKWSSAQLSCNIIQQHPYPLFLLLCWTYAIKNYMNNVYLMFSFVLNSKSITGMLNNIQEHLIFFFYQALHVFIAMRQRNTSAF